MSNWLTKEECDAFYDAMTNPTTTFWLGVEKERQQNRAAAFGAIRRAAKKARMYDHTAEVCDSANYPCDFRVYVGQASAIRRAIRAAIGSDKT